MFKRLGGGSSLWRPKNPHSLEYLKYLHGVLIKNEKVTDGNRRVLVEALRAISEILIWGDQNDSTVFDFFLERQMLSHFLSIMKQDTAGSGSGVCVQLLQTLNILFENIRHETSLYFLLSNNHVNSIITHRFDLTNDEIMAYFISFLKTLSLKLNSYTVHFFFNEATGEFPLFTESLKLYDYPESMVRIAVRTIVLNVVRVPETQAFVRDHSRDYLRALCRQLLKASLELDVFVRSAENVAGNRERLRDMVDALVDQFHYVNDLLQVPALEELVELLSARYLQPLLLTSLVPRRVDSAVLLAQPCAFFLLSQFLAVLTHQQLVMSLLSSFLFDDEPKVWTNWVRTTEDYELQAHEVVKEGHGVKRIFYESFLSAMHVNEDDYLPFFALLLLHSIFQNKADVGELLGVAQLPCVHARATMSTDERPPRPPSPEVQEAILVDLSSPSTETAPAPVAPLEPPPVECEPRLFEALLGLVDAAAGGTNGKGALRGSTLQLLCLVLRQLVITVDCNDVQRRLEERTNEVKRKLREQLADVVHAESLFLEMFEDEYAEFESARLILETLGAELLLRPADSPLSGLSLHKRNPSGNEERIRATIQHYLHIRKLVLDLRGQAETELPLRVEQTFVEVSDCINLHNSDLLSCTVVPSGGGQKPLSRFLVTNQLQLILVEPDAKKAGWAVVRFVGLLQDTQLSGDPGDSRALHVIVEATRRKSPLLSAKLVFDDHIRCMAAKQRLTKGRNQARALKLAAICTLLKAPHAQIPRDASPRSVNPYKVVKGCAPGSVRKQVTSHSRSPVPPSSRSTTDTIPDDPHTSGSASSSIQHI